MDAANIAPRKIFRAKKTLRVSDRQQWEALLRRRPHSENEQPFKECDHQENNLQIMDAECIDGGKPDKHFISNRAKSDLPKSELNQNSPFHCKNEVIKAKFRKLSGICVTEKLLENSNLKSQEDGQLSGHLETKRQCPQQKEQQNISLLRKTINLSSKTGNQNVTATNGSAIHISSYILKEDFNRTSKTYSTKIPELLDQKNYVKSLSLDKKWNVEPVLRIIDVEDLKFVSSDSNDRTSNRKKIKHSIGPILEKLSTEARGNMCNVHLSALHVTHKVNDNVEESIQNEGQNSSVSKYLNEEGQSQIDESRSLIDYQEGIECSPIILMEMRSSDKAVRKRTHSRSEEKSNKRIKTSDVDKSDHLDLSSKKQSTETTKKMSLEEIQKVLQQKMVTKLSNDVLDNKLEELTKRIENIDCRQKHEELAKTIQTRIKRLERKVKAALQTVNTVTFRKKPEEQSEMAPVPQYATTVLNSNNASEPGSLTKHMDSSIALAVASVPSSRPLPYKKTPDSSNYELNLQLPERTSDSVPEDAKIARNIPLPKNLDTVTPASTNYCDISKTTQRNEVSPDSLTLQPISNGQMIDAKQGSNLMSSQIVIDLTEDDQCINNQSRKRESQIQTSVTTTGTQAPSTQSDNQIGVNPVQMSHISDIQPAKPQISATNVQPSPAEIVQIFSVGGPMKGSNVMTENLKPVDPIMDQQLQHFQVSIKSVHPAPLPETPTTSDLPSEADNTSPPQKPELNLAQVRKPKGIALSWNVTDVSQICAPVHCYQLYAYHEDPNLKCPSQWKIIGEIKALPLPMACTLTQFVLGNKYYFTVRAKDIYGRFGPFCEPQTICLLES